MQLASYNNYHIWVFTMAYLNLQKKLCVKSDDRAHTCETRSGYKDILVLALYAEPNYSIPTVRERNESDDYKVEPKQKKQKLEDGEYICNSNSMCMKQ